MAEVVSVDKSGRLVIPKSLREELGIGEDTKFLISSSENGRVSLQKLDIREIASRLEKELKVDIDSAVKRVRKEINEKARKKYPSLFD
ncbi:MAG: AbrB family transcriptional regulator [Candidatus Hydrothermarchaeota archaeon]|nr:AbrB family transcriptional regulator [Candidatus Hydrothermarchaeota archaeon]